MTQSNITAIMPFLTVVDAQKAVAFYISAFDAVVIERYEIADEKLSYSIAIDGAVFCVGDEEPQFGNLAPNAESASAVRIILKTQKADAIFAKALQLGAIEMCPMTTEDDWRIGKLKDPFGHIWEIGFVL